MYLWFSCLIVDSSESIESRGGPNEKTEVDDERMLGKS